VVQIEVKAAAAGEIGGAVEATDDPHVFRIIGSVTGVVDSVKDRIWPGGYADTLGKRTPKIIKDHSWSDRLGKVLQIDEYPPGDARLPKTTAGGKPWPREAGALVAEVRLFQSREGKDAAERWREYGPDQQFSIGYVVPEGGSVTRNGIREIKTLELFEISDVLWGANDLCGPMPPALATKMLDVIAADVDHLDEVEMVDDGQATESLDMEAWFATDDGVEDLDAAWSDLDATADDIGEMADGTLLITQATKTLLGDDYEAKYDTSPVGTPGGRANWVDQAGGLPPFIRAVAHALLRKKGMTKSRAIATAIATIKRWAAGTGNVSAATRTKAQKTIAEWERMKAGTSTKTNASAAALSTQVLDLFGWSPDADPTANKGAAVAADGKGVSMSRLSGTVEERQDALRDAVTDLLLPPQNGDAERGDLGYVHVDGTYPDRVVASVEWHHRPAAESTQTFEIPYSWDGDVPTLGKPKPVRLILTASGDDDDVDPTEALLATLVDSLDYAVGGVKALRLPADGALEVKAGRVLSAANLAALQEAAKRLMAVLKAAGVDVTGPAPVAAPATEGKTAVAGLGDLPDPRVLVESLRAAARSDARSPA
jgi:hypothetical protein